MTDSILEATKSAPPSQTSVLMPSPAIQEREKLERDIEKATLKSQAALDELRKREKARAEAPDGVIVSSILDEDPMEKMARRLVPEAFAPPKKRGIASREFDYMPNVTMSVFWNLAEAHKQTVNNGWIPVKDDDNEHASVNELFLYKRDIAFTREEVYNNVRRSREMLKTKDTQIKQAAAGGGGKVLEDDLVVKKENIN
jgi:hypothetical protein